MLTPASEATCPIFTAAPLTLDLRPDFTVVRPAAASATAYISGACHGPVQPPPAIAARGVRAERYPRRVGRADGRVPAPVRPAPGRAQPAVGHRHHLPVPRRPGRRGLGPRPGSPGESVLRLLR